MTMLLLTAIAFSGKAALVLNGLDPIELGQGKEVPGVSRFSAVFGRHEYRFSNEDHLKRFKSDPYRYGVQNGGACGKMGAMTGKGSPDRWAVVEGKIYLFASDGCRTTFLARKEAYLQPGEAAPRASGGDRKQASAIFDRAISAHGGAKALSAVKSVEWTYDIPYMEGDKRKIWHTKWAYLGPNRYAQWEQWDAGVSFFVNDGKRAVEGKPGDLFPIHRDELRELKAKIARNPVCILLGGGGKPQRPLDGGQGFTMVRDDIVYHVSLDPATSRIGSIRFRDRFSGPVASVTVEYSDYETVQGVAFPKTSRTKVESGDWGKPSTITSYVVNGPEPDVFMLATKG